MKTPVKELSAKFGLREKDIKILFKFGAIQIPPSQEDLIFLTKLSKIWRKSKVLAVQLSGKRKAEIQRIINMARGKDEIDEFIESFITEQKKYCVGWVLKSAWNRIYKFKILHSKSLL